ncbi:hypothetical protein QBC35DRAFT_289940 [Podospora australis]|uniref:Hydrolase n=1 Tax=Podospora australis TaxID=1536484 RepID=A0AAN6WQJ9_9PEZI|nr:hypothetical protein QBC35DRAFT_289940 [Podospora australis]
MAPQPRGLLLCFDAFNTLFRPAPSVAVQYALVANEYPKLAKVQPDQVKSAFSAAYRAEAKNNPNYGRTTGGMGPEKWWTNVINNTFQPLLESGASSNSPSQVPPELARKLLHRFSSDEGYELTGDFVGLFPVLRRHFAQRKTPLVVGVISNSDDRVLPILTAFGIKHHGFRYGGSEVVTANVVDANDDINFHCLSYDVGYEKPSRDIFGAAEDMARAVVSASTSGVETASSAPLPIWTKIHVGDVMEEDVEGARAAGGWHAILVKSSPEMTKTYTTIMDRGIPTLASYKNKTAHSLFDVFPPDDTRSSPPPSSSSSNPGKVVRAENVKEVLEWFSTAEI